MKTECSNPQNAPRRACCCWTLGSPDPPLPGLPHWPCQAVGCAFGTAGLPRLPFCPAWFLLLCLVPSPSPPWQGGLWVAERSLGTSVTLKGPERDAEKGSLLSPSMQDTCPESFPEPLSLLRAETLQCFGASSFCPCPPLDPWTAVRRSFPLEGGREAEAGAVLTDLHPILPSVYSAPLRSLHFSPRAEGWNPRFQADKRSPWGWIVELSLPGCPEHQCWASPFQMSQWNLVPLRQSSD